jgi:hypothetical protein
MYKVLLGSVAVIPLLISGCSKPQRENADLKTSDVREAAADSAAETAASPNVGISSAPGVAFNYRYAFRAPNAKIAALQEQHAQMCEKLGLDRCRITGMRYQLVNNDTVSAMLAFKLDPAIARAFGKQGIAAVANAEGMLVDSEISGVDAGADITASNRASAGLRDELAKVEAQLAQPKLAASERAELQAQAAGLRSQIRGQSETRTSARESIATTPMVFSYGSGNLIPGFDGASPIREAIGTAASSFMTMASFLIIAIGALLPWALLGVLGMWIYRQVRRAHKPDDDVASA